jgi:signal transduction histidine kinase
LQKKIAISLLLIILLPVLLLGWFGVRMARNEQQVIEHQLQVLLTAQLKSIDDAIHAYFLAEQKALLEQAPKLPQDAAGIRAYLRGAPRVQQMLVIAADGKRVFPPPDGPVSEAERQFLQRTAAIWNNPQVLAQSDAVSTDHRESTRAATQVAHGWYAWHWNAELHHLFWQRDATNRVTGFELAPVAVMSDIIARLPASGSADDTLGDARVRLINANGQIAYQWGRYEMREGERTLAMLTLSPPLASWKLEYYGAALKAGTAGNWFGMLAGLLAVAFALLGLGWYLYREHTREMRVAEQRVNFVNQVSHELKTPLTNIRMYAELLEDQLADDDEQPRKYIAIITAESQRLSRLIANVLSFSRAQKERPGLHLQQGRVDDIIARCVEAFMPALQLKAIALRVNPHAGALVALDPEVLEQILNNLISNVEKYAASGGMLEIASMQQPGLTTIRVCDRGPGIPKRERERIFQPFYRISSKLTDGVAGTGIGLGIARQLARLHGGDLKLDTAEQGACFVVTLKTEPAGEPT